jgi:hypothetical protein
LPSAAVTSLIANVSFELLGGRALATDTSTTPTTRHAATTLRRFIPSA